MPTESGTTTCSPRASAARSASSSPKQPERAGDEPPAPAGGPLHHPLLNPIKASRESATWNHSQHSSKAPCFHTCRLSLVG
jgi:hypothetical protein